MTFDVNIASDWLSDQSALIINLPTGLFWTAQTNGMDCDHPKMEGICLPISVRQIDDCKYGCDNMQHHTNRSNRDTLARIIDAAIKHGNVQREFHLSFDFSRIDELQEGWWPVIVRIPADKYADNRPEINTIGFIHQGNCD